MYVVTFYSFKGGVGRSMALVNVASELAKSGRRVLMVDFDLEAPGLSEFGLLENHGETPGLVEFVCDYLATSETPDVSKYIYQSNKFRETEDRLWIMPAGCQKGETYQRLFSSINWQNLYEQRDGFLLMEDLRSQWDQVLKPDYVFIDSRTGYTDIAGICTRQLPDAVCLLFTPNKQNLTGLTRITAEIKAQSFAPELRQPQLHFVASNIPSLDDEEQVLAKVLSNFSKQLGYIKPSAIIHHYSSFALLNEAVFTLEYPNSQLASQYRVLANEITKANLRDKLSALEFLKVLSQETLEAEHNFSAHEIEEKLQQLETYFGADRDILYWLSRVRRVAGNLEESYVLVDAAIKNGLSAPRAYLDRVRLRLSGVEVSESKGTEDAIWDDLSKVLALRSEVSVTELLWTIRLAFRVGRTEPGEFATAPAVKSLSNEDLIYLFLKLEDSKNGIKLMIRLASDALRERSLSHSDMNELLGFVGNAYIAFGQLDKAITALTRITPSEPSTIVLPAAFNLAMAKYWTGDRDAKLYFRRVLELLPRNQVESDLNRIQCLSFALWATGEHASAHETLAKAKSLALERRAACFSCWRYMEVPPSSFLEDLYDMERLYNGEDVMPVFMEGAA